jgi:hypothetical protein
MAAVASDPQFPLFPGVNARVRSHHRIVYCAVCRAKEARYGFRDENQPDPPSTFCFECFCREIERRHAVVVVPGEPRDNLWGISLGREIVRGRRREQTDFAAIHKRGSGTFRAPRRNR